jgi:hypothetical protein
MHALCLVCGWSLKSASSVKARIVKNRIQVDPGRAQARASASHGRRRKRKKIQICFAKNDLWCTRS